MIIQNSYKYILDDREICNLESDDLTILYYLGIESIYDGMDFDTFKSQTTQGLRDDSNFDSRIDKLLKYNLIGKLENGNLTINPFIFIILGEMYSESENNERTIEFLFEYNLNLDNTKQLSIDRFLASNLLYIFPSYFSPSFAWTVENLNNSDVFAIEKGEALDSKFTQLFHNELANFNGKIVNIDKNTEKS